MTACFVLCPAVLVYKHLAMTSHHLCSAKMKKFLCLSQTVLHSLPLVYSYVMHTSFLSPFYSISNAATNDCGQT